MSQDGIARIDEGRQHEARPLDPIPAPADPARVGLALDGIELVATFEAYAPARSQ
jgi:hypothetical protein